LINLKYLKKQNNYGEIQMQEAMSSRWRRNDLQVIQTLGNSYDPMMRDRYVIVHKDRLSQCSAIDLLSYESKRTDAAHVLHPQLATLKLIWKPTMRSHRNGWRKVMHERLSWQRISSLVCDDSNTGTFKGLVVPLYAFLETEACYAFVTGHLVNGSSLSVLIQATAPPEPVLQVLFAQMALAVHLCHKSGLLLRCLHRNSFIVDRHCNCLLADFQSAKLTDRSSSTRLPVCALEYLAPEQIRSQSYARSADWFSLGVLLLELLVGCSPLKWYCQRNAITLQTDSDGTLMVRPSNYVLLKGTSCFLLCCCCGNR
jgi:serine/threonine protein kinase